MRFWFPSWRSCASRMPGAGVPEAGVPGKRSRPSEVRRRTIGHFTGAGWRATGSGWLAAGAGWLSVLVLAGASLAAESPASETDFFEARIRPVLVAQCYECHSATADHIEGGLRLDSRNAAREGGDSGPAVVPGNPEDSLILEALRHDGLEMPPGKKLSAQVVADFERWIEQGASDPRDAAGGGGLVEEIRRAARRHWAFQPIGRPDPPSVDSDQPVGSPVDHFIHARLREAGLAMSPPADKVTLARRAYFDLLGLPPTPEEVARFVADDSPDAFARLVDRLLENPHYGERWGRYWLDVARYADNKGYVFFEDQKYAWAWTYRDYVVRAFNEDLPFDRFIREQLAADQLELGDDRRALAAMGFLTLGARFMNNAHDILDDRIDVVTRGLMGLTVSCARCHDHKYDPVSQRDYYALYGVFRSSVEPVLPPEFQPAGESEADRKFQEGMRQRLDALRAFIAQQRQQIIAGARERAAEYLMAVHRKRNQPVTEDFMLLTDKGALNPAMVQRWEVYLEDARREADPIWRVWHAYADLPDEGFAEAARAVHARLFEPATAATLHPLVRQAFAEAPPNEMSEVAQRYGQLLAEVNQAWIARCQAAETAHAESATSPEDPPPAAADALPDALPAALPDRLPDESAESLRQVLYGPQSPPMIPRELSWGFLDLLPDRPTQGEFKKLLKEVESWSMNQPAAPPRAMVLRDAESPFDPVVFLRGNPHRRGEPVARRYLEFFSRDRDALFDEGSGRRELAERIVADDNPLTARVLVNRVWMHHFREGLVRTPSDFGLRSDPPSHPELLDWLATSLRDNGWSLKQLHRTIMNSATYRQASRPAAALTEPGPTEPGKTGSGPTEAGKTEPVPTEPGKASLARALEVDPANRLLWAYPRRRLDFEALRDELLAVSGALDPTVGGPPQQLLEGFHPRRTIYNFVDRMNLPGLLRSFDFPDPAASSPGRERTTVAPQALFFMNHPFVDQCARRLLQRPEVADCATAEAKIDRVYRILFSRPPDEAERRLGREFIEGQAPSDAAAAPWKYGYGAVDEQRQRVTGFTELTHWTGTRWQAGPQLPDPRRGWVFVDRLGGHPAATLERCVIRRWTAPRSGTYRLAGTLRHVPEPGNGVRGRIVSSRDGVLGTWTVHHGEAATPVGPLKLQAGDTLDLVVDFHGEILHDEHQWPVVIRAIAEKTETSPFRAAWDSQADFRGPTADPWLDYVHALLMTNEFVFID